MDPVTLSTAVGWGISIAGWIMSPIATRLLNKAFPLIKPGDAMENLEEVVIHAIPRLKLTLEAAEASQHKELLQDIAGDLKSAFYDMEDILDEVEYNRLSKQQLHNSKEKHKSIPDDDGAGTSNKVVGSTGRLYGLLKETMKKIKELSHKARKTICLTSVPRTKGSAEQRPNVASKYVKIPTTTSHSADKLDGLTGHLYGLLKETLKKIKELTDKAQKTISLTSVPTTKGSAEQRPDVTSKYVKTPTTTSHSADKVTGRDEHRDKIINMLHDTCPSSTGVGIHGLPGSGKTTLAQYVCEFEKRDGHFDIVMWIHVTENFSVHAIYKEMFEAASESKTCPQSNSLDVLQGELEKQLHQKRFLLVLDDVWRTKGKGVGEQQLPELFSPIKKFGKEGSKILVTTRNKEALLDLGTGVTCTPYEIPDLDEKVFLELFMYHALGSAADQGTSILQEIGAEIAEKLKRLPLAAKTVGGHLRRKKDVQSWITVRDSDILEHTGALWWSYHHLDEHVRRCFAYCSIFPRRFQLDRDELVKLWVAEGFINMVTTKEVEDVGRDYFDELVATSFLQLGTKEHKNDKDYYLIHDLMHDLAEEVAGSDCFSIQYGLTGTSEIPKDVRHLFVEDVRDPFLDTNIEGPNIESSPIMDKIVKLEKLRTLIIHNSGHQVLNAEDLNKMFTGLRKLRVLVMKYCFIENLSVPDSIGTAKHLRYLALLTGDDGIRVDWPRLTFPNTLAKLYHLQVLDFGADAILSFPSVEEMVNLINLRHVIGLQDHGFQYKSSSLQTIPPFSVSGYDDDDLVGPRYELEHLSDLNKLQGELEIHQLGYATTMNEALKANLAAKKRLTELLLAWDDNSGCEDDDQAEVLEGLCPPMLLERLEILGYRGPRYPNWMVCKQTERRRLLKLTLKHCSRLEAISDSDFFVYLQSLHLGHCDWEALPDNMEQLKSLKELMIVGCLKIRSLPTLPRTLGYFYLSGCHYMLHESCETSGDPNCQKIAHVTKKVIREPNEWSRRQQAVQPHLQA